MTKQPNPAKRIIIAQLGLLLLCLGNPALAATDTKDMVWIPGGEFSMGSKNPLKESGASQCRLPALNHRQRPVRQKAIAPLKTTCATPAPSIAFMSMASGWTKQK
jgi:hypothetical protein